MSERDLQMEFGRRWAYRLIWLLDQQDCPPESFWRVIETAKAALEIHGGVAFILEEATLEELSAG